MPISSMDGLVASLAGAQRHAIYKASITTVAGAFYDLLTAAGLPAAGSTPATGAGTTYTRTTAGAIPIVNPPSGKTLYLVQLNLACSSVCRLILYDRLWANSGFSGTVTTAQTVSPSPTLPRWSPGDGVECWMEVYTALGSTSVTATLSYTNSDGTSGRSGTLTVPASMGANRMLPFSLQAGDRGVQTVASVTLSASTGTAGNFGLTLLRRIAEVDIPTANVGRLLDAFSVGMPDIPNDAALYLMQLASTTSSGVVTGGIVLGTD